VYVHICTYVCVCVFFVSIAVVTKHRVCEVCGFSFTYTYLKVLFILLIIYWPVSLKFSIYSVVLDMSFLF